MYCHSLTSTTHKHHAFLKQFLASIPPQTAATFTEIQLIAIQQAFQQKFSNCAAVDIKFSIPLPKQHFSLTIRVGKDKKSKKRLNYPIYQQLNQVIVTKSGLRIITALMGTLCMIEVVPSIPTTLFPAKRSIYYHP
ncbi:hypothetical protein H6G80_18645 [Nostoc sp. FACHB-87]|uniref:hypothetical protein n=1 Tax=Nostocaceae TaxID=1162 RepID=UPI0016870BC9|nr:MULTISPECIES: hypothetical protein [Nostocaceae]MBD2456088.1 hypothetical protein [Nostoc sp. FACHB-87]MBD2476489.1 hypothetical protein [Anabaena sp. FACHB-83]